jgi:enamine deaminase RidA (YjgF/YER057c/UK114 family)
VVKVGNIIEVAGTTATDENGSIVGLNDPYIQTKFILKKIEGYLIKAGASMEDVIRTRMFVTDIGHWKEIGKAHREYFKTIKPAASMLEVSKLIDPELLVEIEVTAITSE